MCTSVRFSNTKGNMFFGRNLDWEFGYGEGPMIAPRNWNRTWRFEDDAHRQLASRIAQEGTRPQAVIGIGIVAEDTPLYFDCMNESGLASGGLLFAGFAEYEAKPVEGKLNVTAYELPLWVCRNFTTVDQAQAALEHVAIVGAISSAKQRAALDKLIDRRLRIASSKNSVKHSGDRVSLCEVVRCSVR